ncbi:MAG: methionine--tRNA ligase, partial [Alphaproteobacteria bacterium]|nr:methionine--tRNA ligase [Alphaproteobacteria bacterium]
RMGLNLVHVFAHYAWPVIPNAASIIHHAIQPAPQVIPWPTGDMEDLLDQLEPGAPVSVPEVLFTKITDEQIGQWKERFGGE